MSEATVADGSHHGLHEREAVGIFDDEVTMQDAVEDLLTAGFRCCRSGLDGPPFLSDQAAQRERRLLHDILGDAEGLVGGFAIVPAVGTRAAAIVGSGPALCHAGSLIGLGLALALARRRHKGFECQAGDGGFLLWIRTRTPASRSLAKYILDRHAGHSVHDHYLLPLAP